MLNDTKKGIHTERPQWTTLETGGNESVSFKGEKPALPPYIVPEVKNHEGFFTTLLNGFRKLANFTLNALLWGALIASGWFGRQILGAPDFSHARAQFEIEGHKEEGERLYELGQVCRNDASLPMACKVLYFNQPEVMTARKF